MNIDLVLKRLELIKEGKGINTISDTEAIIILNEIERLNNVIKRLEEDLREMYLTFGEFSEEYTENRIKELKGDGSNDSKRDV